MPISELLLLLLPPEQAQRDSAKGAMAKTLIDVMNSLLVIPDACMASPSTNRLVWPNASIDCDKGTMRKLAQVFGRSLLDKRGLRFGFGCELC